MHSFSDGFVLFECLSSEKESTTVTESTVLVCGNARISSMSYKARFPYTSEVFYKPGI